MALGSVVITDPGDQPLSPDQSAFPICWPWGLAGGPSPRMNWSPMRSACQPVGKYGKDSSRVLQSAVVWVKTAHEKHPSAETVDGLGDTAFSSVTVPSPQISRRFPSVGPGGSLEDPVPG